MKKIIAITFLMTLFMTLVACEPRTAKFYDDMDLISEPKETGGYWVSHEYRLNDDETLYYAPKVLRFGEDTYLNKNETYFIYRKSGWFNNVTILNYTQLRELFDK